jgi:hypothetical protein
VTALHIFITVTGIYRVVLIRAFTLKLYMLWKIRVILRAVSLIPTNHELEDRPRSVVQKIYRCEIYVDRSGEEIATVI